jgi:hypothetical protein
MRYLIIIMLLGAIIFSTGCVNDKRCEGIQYDKEEQKCCGGNIYPKQSGFVCCEDKYFYFNFSGSIRCCIDNENKTANTYDEKNESCCFGRVISYPEAVCCNESVSCREGMRCCNDYRWGMKCYDPARSECVRVN